MILKKSWGQGGPGPQGPLDPLLGKIYLWGCGPLPYYPVGLTPCVCRLVRNTCGFFKEILLRSPRNFTSTPTSAHEGQTQLQKNTKRKLNQLHSVKALFMITDIACASRSSKSPTNKKTNPLFRRLFFFSKSLHKGQIVFKPHQVHLW